MYILSVHTIQLCGSVSFLVGNRSWSYILMYLEYNSVVVLCQFFGSGGKQFLTLRTYLVYNTVVRLCNLFWLWWEIVLKMRTCYYKTILLGYFIMIRQRMCVFIRPNTLLLCIFLFCIYLLYHTDLQVEVQIRILLKDKYRKSCKNANTGNQTLIS